MPEGRQRSEQDTQVFLSRLFERLKTDTPGYEWDEKHLPFHSSYDNWHTFGVLKAANKIYPGTRRQSKDSLKSADSRSKATPENKAVSERGGRDGIPVVARISRHIVRLEREYKLAEKLKAEVDPQCDHFVEPIQFLRLPARLPGESTLVAFIVRAPGPNYLKELVEFGPNVYRGSVDHTPATPTLTPTPTAPVDHHYLQRAPDTFEKIPMHLFMDFAIGAAECCEILHHGKELVHGELRADAFHFECKSGRVRLINFGSGARSFENGLTSAGWSSITSEVGIEHKLQFIAPEQTGRMPAEPDTRTDIYSLGILFWTMLTGEPAYRGSSPLEIMQALLSKRVPAVDSIRLDVPHVLSNVIHKMTQKTMDDRYQSSAGLKYDLQEIKRLLGEGDITAIDTFVLGSKDVSCFFHLPSEQIGRQEQRQALISVIENTAAHAAQTLPISKRGLYSLSSHTSTTLSGDRADTTLMDENLSVSSASGGDRDGRHSSMIESNPPETLRMLREHTSQDSVVSSTEGAPLEQNPSSESRTSTGNNEGTSSKPSFTNTGSLNAGSDGSLLRTAQRLKKRGKTVTVSISGSAGLGKSSLLRTAQNTARKHGYYASAKFDQIKRAPFEPVLRVMSSIFRQIFSENDVNTDFHNNIRSYIKPYWPTLSDYLDLPPWLLSQFMPGTSHYSASSTPTPRQKCGAQGNTAADWLRAGGSNSSKSNRFVQTYIEVLRLLALQNFFVLCFDDLQFADAESLDLLCNVVKANIPIVLILTFRDESSLPPTVQPLLEKATKIDLMPFSEDETAEYVANTLHRPAGVVATLAAVVQQATRGNPFFIREMLDVCYRKGCIYYSWRTSQWEFDLDKVFAEFSSPNADDFSSNNFLHRRLQELPRTSKCVLRWACLIGNSFSFNLVKQAMSCDCSRSVPRELLPPDSGDPVSGLQGAISAYILVATDLEDRFRFSHDRYLQAAEMLCEEFDKAEMHYVIAIAMMKHTPYDRINTSSKALFDQARHICNAIEVIKKRRTGSVAPFRDLLYQAAETAREQGARSISLFFFQHCLLLLPDDPWDSTLPDVSYQETLTLLTNSAAAYWYLGYFDESGTILQEIFRHARSPADKTPGFIIQSRMYAQQGDSRTAFLSMKRALLDLGISISDTTWEECDQEFRELLPLINVTDRELFEVQESEIDQDMITIGAVMVEMLSAAYWSDGLLLYYLTLKIVRLYLERGLFPQLSVGFVFLAAIAATRFDMIEEAVELGNTVLKLLDCFDTDSYTLGRGLTLHALFLAHFTTDIKDQLPALERGMEATVLAGDRILHLLNLGVMAAYQLWSSHDYQEIGAFISYQYEAFPNWPKDLRGGVILLSVQQYIHAMQGKTGWRSADTILDDENHNGKEYVNYIASNATAPARPRFFYDSYRIAALFRFGHYNAALKLADSVCENIDDVYSLRHHYYDLFYVAMSLIAKIREDTTAPDVQKHLARVRKCHAKIQRAASIRSINFDNWLDLLAAEIAELEERFSDAVLLYEAAIDGAVVRGTMSEEALACELYGEFLSRRGSTRPARSLINDAIAVYHRLSALGKAEHVTEKHAFLLHGTKSLITADAGTQTTENEDISYNLAHNEANLAAETPADRTHNYLTRQEKVPQHSLESDFESFAAVGLDMIDLASILDSSQLLSSELKVENLLSKLTNIIVDSTGAGLCAIAIKEEDVGWIVAAVSGPDSIAAFQQNVGQPVEKANDPVAKQVTLYVLRFREEVFCQNVLDDERFGNVPEEWRRAYPEGKAMIALPIFHGNESTMLGSLYIEGLPNSFTQRNLTVLRLLVNQIAISIANALLFKRLEKVSASNISMLEIQKQALAQARDSERKAKIAEAKAMEMVRLKEEAAKAKSMFLANVSHELRTPLNGVIGMSELLKGTTLNSEQAGFADSIRVCADTLLSVINDILDFSKLEAGKMQMFNVQLSLVQTISEVVRALSYTNMERNLKTLEQIEIDPGQLVMGDPVRLHQILMNLLSNAYKFTAKGTVTIKAVIDEEDDDGVLVTCSVIDTGIGISEEQRKKLFQPFSQADSSTARSYGGTGLGLSICKAIIENVLGGRIWLESNPGVGTTVSFQLRFQKVKKSAEVTTQGMADPMAMFGSGTSSHTAGVNLTNIPRESLRICIAEDNPINQKIAISFVQKLGFKCEAYGDGQQAVDALLKASKAGDPFHLVLMDVQMPVLDGYHATREIRRQTDPVVRDVLVIAMTASAIRGDREKCLEAGMNNYLAKPVRAHVLKQMLEGYLNQFPKAMPDLQQKANQLAKEIINEVNVPDGTATSATTTMTTTNTTTNTTPARAPGL
ncbi:hypothetical protein AAFC00_001209 [Neodothiora populina]|uniref:histidine kinase n=1 Tax=Neodothiora populina TaxID=2781224 RepID=A0ABR3PP57_9PEZI